MSHSCAKCVLYSTMITNHMTNSLIGPILIRNSHVSARFKLRSTGLSSEISLLGFAERRSPVYASIVRPLTMLKASVCYKPLHFWGLCTYVWMWETQGETCFFSMLTSTWRTLTCLLPERNPGHEILDEICMRSQAARKHNPNAAH